MQYLMKASNLLLVFVQFLLVSFALKKKEILVSVAVTSKYVDHPLLLISRQPFILGLHFITHKMWVLNCVWILTILVLWFVRPSLPYRRTKVC